MGCLEGKVIVVTGGSGFLGTQFCEAIRNEQGRAVSFDHNLTEVADTTYIGDVTCEETVAACRDWVIAHYGRLDGLVVCAARNPKVTSTGLGSRGDFETTQKHEFQLSLHVGLTGAFLCAREFGGVLAAQGHGSIVFISSELGLVAPNQSLYGGQSFKPVAYSVEKHGLIGLTRYLASYWGRRGVRVNALAPGGMENGQPPEFIERRSQTIPLGRMARPGEFNNVLVTALTSPYMTGSIIAVDGGLTCW